MFEEYCNETSRMRGCAGMMACGFGLLRATKPPCARAVPRSARRRGAPADPPPGKLGGVARAPPTVFRWVQAGSRALGAASAPARYGSPPFARRGPALATARGKPPDGVLCAGRIQTFTPPYGQTQFFGCRKRLAVPVLHAQSVWQPPDCGSGAQLVVALYLERCASRDHDWMKS